ncbi:hypothetical protein [Candidatus Hepatobacter penaei]|uniref:hypothetical protein n=1 Tax=Candidatus Hepatobacter penaei TaxID=1274402 RepID=UPI0012E02F49|nr:hypothetical protein [Candidatus Hepatobacter penaei]
MHSYFFLSLRTGLVGAVLLLSSFVHAGVSGASDDEGESVGAGAPFVEDLKEELEQKHMGNVSSAAYHEDLLAEGRKLEKALEAENKAFQQQNAALEQKNAALEQQKAFLKQRIADLKAAQEQEKAAVEQEIGKNYREGLQQVWDSLQGRKAPWAVAMCEEIKSLIQYQSNPDALKKLKARLVAHLAEEEEKQA